MIFPSTKRRNLSVQINSFPASSKETRKRIKFIKKKKVPYPKTTQYNDVNRIK